MTKTTTVREDVAPTYNGVAMTRVEQIVGSAECTAELWYLSNPSIGTYNVSIPNASALIITVIASSYVDATVTGAILDVYNSTNFTMANPSLAVTTGFAGEAIVDVFGSGYTSPATANNQTLLYKKDEGVWSSHAQYALQASAGLITFNWTITSDDVAFIVGAFRGVSAVTPKSFGDSGGGSDAFVNPYRAMPFSETGHGGESFGIPFKVLPFGDVGHGAEAFNTPFRTMGFADVGHGVDVFVLEVSTGWRKLKYFSEPPTSGMFNKLRFASEPPVVGAWNKLLFYGE
jgi:hypothetical protein